MTKNLSVYALLSIDNYNRSYVAQNSRNIFQDAKLLSARTEGVLALQGSPKSL